MGWWKVQHTDDIVGDDAFTISETPRKKSLSCTNPNLGDRPVARSGRG
jgi:hypothetical protein